MKPRYRKHDHPLWPNFVNAWIYAHITHAIEDDEPFDVLEQIPARHIDGSHYQLCSAPMTIRGFALGDIVETKRFGRMSYIADLIQHAGHYTLHIHYDNQLSSEARKDIEIRLMDSGCSIDRWDEIRCTLDAIDGPSADKAFQILSECMERSELVFETCWDEPEYGVVQRREVPDWPTEIVMHRTAYTNGNPELVKEVLAPVRFDSTKSLSGVCYEQLCLKRADQHLVEICCVPFRFWNLNLGDVVHICSNERGHQEVRHIESVSGNKTIRVEVDQKVTNSPSPELLSLVKDWQGISEFEEDGIKGAISIPGEEKADQFLSYLKNNLSNLGLSRTEKTWG